MYYNEKLKTFKAGLYSSEKHFLFDNCGFLLCEIKLFGKILLLFPMAIQEKVTPAINLAYEPTHDNEFTSECKSENLKH